MRAAYLALDELGGALGLVLGLGVESVTDLAQDGVSVEDDIKGHVDDVQTGRELRVGVALLVAVAGQARGDGPVLGAPNGPAPDLLLIAVEDDQSVGGGLRDESVEFELERGVWAFVTDPDPYALVGSDVSGADLASLVVDHADRVLDVWREPVEALNEDLLEVAAVDLGEKVLAHLSITPIEQTMRNSSDSLEPMTRRSSRFRRSSRSKMS